MSIALLASVLLASLAGSLHCAGMCGPFAAFWADAGPARTRAQVGYHGARLVTYAGLGALAGLLGAALEAATAGRLRSAAALTAGIVLVAWGLLGLLRHFGVSLPLVKLGGTSHRITRVLSSLRERPPVQRALIVGSLTTLIPCGWLHAFVVAAAGTGSPASGALLMTAFWLGTVPILAALGGGVMALLGPMRRHAPAIAALAVLACGIVTLVHHARLMRSEQPCHEARPAISSSP